VLPKRALPLIFPLTVYPGARLARPRVGASLCGYPNSLIVRYRSWATVSPPSRRWCAGPGLSSIVPAMTRFRAVPCGNRNRCPPDACGAVRKVCCNCRRAETVLSGTVVIQRPAGFSIVLDETGAKTPNRRTNPASVLYRSRVSFTIRFSPTC
jgi:hypothetical protein